MTPILLLLFAAAPVDFETDVLPILTKAGCNAGACHGAAAGRGGFRLSLFGGDPAADHQEIMLAEEGRRLNFLHPERSLFLRKPTGDLEHEGGIRIDADGEDYDLIFAWIQQGGRRLNQRSLVGLEATLERNYVAALPATVRLQAIARYSDGSTRDVTDQVVVVTGDASSLVALGDGSLRVLRGGRHSASVRYVSQIASVQITAPIGEEPLKQLPIAATNFIDKHVDRVLNELRLPAEPIAKEAVLLRRVSLDLTGALPAPERARRYLADQSPDKYERLVDELLASDAFTVFWAHRFEEWLRLRPPSGDKQAAKAFHQWVKRQVETNARFDRMVHEMVTAAGDSRDVSPATFHRLTPGAREAAEHASETLLGVRLACANCHNHPLDIWTQDDYHGLAAIFAGVDRGRIVGPSPLGEVSHPRTGERATKRVPGERFLNADEDGLQSFADWVVADKNPYFARAAANRLWKALMGRGLVEPVDDLRTTNPATHPELLAQLAESFRRKKYDYRSLLKEIALSAAYQRSIGADSKNEFAKRYYASATAKPLPAEVLADAIATVTGERFTLAGFEDHDTVISVFDSTIKSAELDSLGRCDRSESCETGSFASAGLSRSLDLLNGKVLNRRVSAKSGRLQQLLASGKSNEAIIAEFYWRAFCRPPSAAENQFWKDSLTSDDRNSAFEDFLWSLLASRSFSHNQ